ncbi:DUF6090 family protein [Namhaeicola litoreus]|uniref:DUF6090 family protein n=1 Tax=Namhaeicola litoreus TaxID=1052145 RepID=A0ABW3Y0X0_9FLAO
MIAFLRNMRQQLAKENKFGRYFRYAIGEIILVVIGILIALQINNWNTRKQESKQEQKILNILKSEFTYNAAELQRNMDKASLTKSRIDSLLFLIDHPEIDIDVNDLRELVLRVTGYSTYDPSNGALTNLISSGQLELIKNDSLKIALSKWFGEVQDTKEDELRLIRFGDTHIDPIRLEYINYNANSRFDRNSAELLNHANFENILLRTSRAFAYNIENYEHLGKEIENIMSLIDGEIKL